MWLFFTFLPPASSFFFTITFCLCQQLKRDDRRPQNQDLLTAAVRTHQTHVHQCAQEWAHACLHSCRHKHTNTQVKTTVSHLVGSPRYQPILSATTLENTLHAMIYLFNFSGWWFFSPQNLPFNFQANYFGILHKCFFNILSNLSVKLIFKRFNLKNLYTF